MLFLPFFLYFSLSLCPSLCLSLSPSPSGGMPPQGMAGPGPPTNIPQGLGQDYNAPQQYGLGGINSNGISNPILSLSSNNMQGMNMGMPPPSFPSDSSLNQIQNQQRPQPHGTALFGGNQSWGTTSGPEKNPPQGLGPGQGQGQQNFEESTTNFANSLPLINDMDLTCECNPQFMQASVSKMVVSQSAATASKIPLGIVIKPMAGDKGAGNDLVDVVDFGTTGIIRCKRCRTYINPYVTWTDNGRRWKCNICGMLNDVPTAYFSHLDNNGQRRDRDQRYVQYLLRVSKFLSVCVSVCLCVCLCVCLSVSVCFCLSVYVSACLSIYLSICVSLCLAGCLYIYLQTICLMNAITDNIF